MGISQGYVEKCKPLVDESLFFFGSVNMRIAISGFLRSCKCVGCQQYQKTLLIIVFGGIVHNKSLTPKPKP